MPLLGVIEHVPLMETQGTLSTAVAMHTICLISHLAWRLVLLSTSCTGKHISEVKCLETWQSQSVYPSFHAWVGMCYCPSFSIAELGGIKMSQGGRG